MSRNRLRCDAVPRNFVQLYSFVEAIEQVLSVGIIFVYVSAGRRRRSTSRSFFIAIVCVILLRDIVRVKSWEELMQSNPAETRRCTCCIDVCSTVEKANTFLEVIGFSKSK